MKWPWQLPTRLQRWSGCGAWVVMAVSLSSFIIDEPWWLLPAVLLLWLPLMVAAMVQMHFELRRLRREMEQAHQVFIRQFSARWRKEETDG